MVSFLHLLNSSPVASFIGEVGEREGEDWGSSPVTSSIGEVRERRVEDWGGGRGLTRRLNVNEASLDEQVYSPLSSTFGSEIVRRLPSINASSGMSPSTLLQKWNWLIFSTYTI